MPHELQQLRLLHAIWQGTLDSDLTMAPEEIDMVLGLRPATCRLALRALHSLFDVPLIRPRFGYRGWVRMLHASLGDYLGDARRSGRWCVSLPWLHLDYLESVVRFMSSPAITSHVKELHRYLVRGLPKLLSNVAPSQALIELLRNRQFQRSLYSTRYMGEVDWPPVGAALSSGISLIYVQRNSGYPLDLIQFWDDHRLISTRTEQMKLGNGLAGRHIRLYQTETVECTQIIKFLTTPGGPTKVHNSDDVLWWCISHFRACAHNCENNHYQADQTECDFPSNYKIFQPFVTIRGLPEFFPDGDSPLDFLNDPRRAGNLYSDPHHIADAFMRLWIPRVKQDLQDGWPPPFLCPRILAEIETLDLAQLCDPMHIDHEDHWDTLRRADSPAVLRWLRRFPNPPLQAIEFWEEQIACIEQCSFPRPSDESDPDDDTSTRKTLGIRNDEHLRPTLRRQIRSTKSTSSARTLTMRLKLGIKEGLRLLRQQHAGLYGGQRRLRARAKQKEEGWITHILDMLCKKDRAAALCPHRRTRHPSSSTSSPNESTHTTGKMRGRTRFHDRPPPPSARAHV
ncbi:hypothetical protein B0H13DRAFT_1910789 [Mycena leptocephala]|nr:hypothetical protein B0H13DRAFT_1910789 [Mycena leptocephala]